MYGKIIDGNLQIAGNIITTDKGVITNPTEEQLVELGYKVIEYTEKPTYDKEEMKLYETYTEYQDKIIVAYATIELSVEEHNAIIKREIQEEELQITERNKLDYMVDHDDEALSRIQQHRIVIAELRKKLRKEK